MRLNKLLLHGTIQMNLTNLQISLCDSIYIQFQSKGKTNMLEVSIFGVIVTLAK